MDVITNHQKATARSLRPDRAVLRAATHRDHGHEEVWLDIVASCVTLWMLKITVALGTSEVSNLACSHFIRADVDTHIASVI